MPFSDEQISRALETAWILEAGWYGDYITSRGAVDRTRFHGGGHFSTCLHRAIRLLEENLTLEEQDDLILQYRARHSKQLDEETAALLGKPSASKAANTAALLALLGKQQ